MIARYLSNAKANIANDLDAETLFQLSEDFYLGNLFELVMQCRLQDPDVQNTLAQRDWRGMRRDKFADNFTPGLQHFILVQSLLQAEALHQLG